MGVSPRRLGMRMVYNKVAKDVGELETDTTGML